MESDNLFTPFADRFVGEGCFSIGKPKSTRDGRVRVVEPRSHAIGQSHFNEDEMMNQEKRSFVTRGLLVVALAVGILGCQAPPPEPVEPTTEQLVSQLSSGLDLVLEYGEGGSGLAPLFESHAKLQKKDPELAKRVEKDLNELGRATTPEKRKELAKKIQGQLPVAK